MSEGTRFTYDDGHPPYQDQPRSLALSLIADFG